jgi:DNA-binding transcriptional regulator YiaG
MAENKITPQFVTELREKLNLTQAELAYKLDVSITTVSRWESGTCTPHKYHRKALERLGKKTQSA